MIIRNLTVLCYGGGFTLWHYKHDGLLGSMPYYGEFFAPAAHMFKTGDRIMVSGWSEGMDLYVAGVTKLDIRKMNDAVERHASI